jgi:hypothetical protein
MKVLKLGLVLFAGLALITGCTSSKELGSDFPINRDQAIMIAGINVPPMVIQEAFLSISVQDTYWIVNFQFSNGKTVSSISKSELGWAESLGDDFTHSGNLPTDRFSLLTITIDGQTGTIVSRKASDAYIIGPTEPLKERNYVLLLLSLGSGIGGVVIGTVGTWLIIRRRYIAPIRKT